MRLPRRAPLLGREPEAMIGRPLTDFVHPYREARPVATAVAEVERGAGSQFDPAVVSAFVPLACQFGIDLSP